MIQDVFLEIIKSNFTLGFINKYKYCILGFLMVLDIRNLFKLNSFAIILNF